MSEQKPFPEPVRLTGKITRWRESELCEFDGSEPPATERFLSVKEVAQRYGVTTASIWRWQASSRKGAA